MAWFPGGGERKGIGIIVGIVGIEGIWPGSGGRARLGKEGWVVGKVGNVGCGSVGIEGNGGIACLGAWLWLFFKIIFILKYIKIIFFYF